MRLNNSSTPAVKGGRKTNRAECPRTLSFSFSVVESDRVNFTLFVLAFERRSILGEGGREGGREGERKEGERERKGVMEKGGSVERE